VRGFTTTRGVLLVLAVAAAANFSAAHEWGPTTADSPSYLEPARNLAAGRGFIGYQLPLYAVSKVPGYPIIVAPETFRTPGYPLFIALIFLLGGSVSKVIFAQQSINVAIAAGLFLFLVAATRSQPIALIAAVAFAVYPPSVWIASTIMSDTLWVAMLLASIAGATARASLRAHPECERAGAAGRVDVLHSDGGGARLLHATPARGDHRRLRDRVPAFSGDLGRAKSARRRSGVAQLDLQ
jgi:hypothetical protein